MEKVIVPFFDQITGMDVIDYQIRALWVDWAYKPYLIANTLKKILTDIEKDYKEGFQRYYDENKELPGGFNCKVSSRTTYDFSVDPEWAELSTKIKAREDILKNATDQQMKGNTVVDEQGEIIFGVPIKETEIYTVTRK